MKVFHNIASYEPQQPTVLTIGTFDGVHIGHFKIIERLTRCAKEENLESVIITFFPHPRMVLNQVDSVKLLNTIEEKIELIERCGIDSFIIHPFDKTFSELTAEEFVSEILVKKLNLKKIIIGYDHRFGKNRTAGMDELIEFGKKYDFEVEQISAQEIDEVSVSSTKIRTALQEGNITLANSYLNHPYTLSGTVIQGKQLGRKIGFPTANIQVAQSYKLIPKNGVYIVRVELGGKEYKGMLNIGNNPTTGFVSQSIEVHILEFNQDIYDQTLTLHFLKRLREEVKFASVEELIEQLKKDQTSTEDFFQDQ